MHYLITGHTGFKGSWLSLMLKLQGHTVSGVALDPMGKSLFNQANLSAIFRHDLRLDIRNPHAIKKEIKRIEPEVIIHLAAQPLVRESYRIPIETFEVNVIGTLNLLEATRDLESLKAALIVTTDKVYKNKKQLHGYIETDELGGDDPYSASKAAADLASQSWIKNFANVPIAIARAGNVIGGGDWAQDRIIPDLINAYSSNKRPQLRNPNAIRPWQHVLDCLNGYLTLVDYQIANQVGGEWNFGPGILEKRTVADLVKCFSEKWGFKDNGWELDNSKQPSEAGFLLLDSEKARLNLKWTDKLEFESSVSWTCSWFKNAGINKSHEVTLNQINKFLELT